MINPSLVIRDFYVDEAKMQFMAVLEKIGGEERVEPIHVDMHPNGRELRVMLTFGTALEFLNFQITEDGDMVDCSYIMRSYPDGIDAFGIDSEGAAMLWQYFGCQEFILGGKVFDKDKSKAYGVKIGDAYDY
jgi:hypothetical protein